MRRNYVTPQVKKVAFSYQENIVVASGQQTAPKGDPWFINECTWSTSISDCSSIYNVKARGLDNCTIQGDGDH